MRRIETRHQILAIIYADGELAAEVMRRMAGKLMACGARCAGFIQRDEPPPVGRSRCDMLIECLATGERLKISEDRGAFARGCRLDVDVLAAAIVSARETIRSAPDVLVVNKFGKTESEGGGFRSLIADATELGIPVLIAVPWRNIESWRHFAGEFATEIAADAITDEDDGSVLAMIGLDLSAEPGAASLGPSISATGRSPALGIA
jgi:nucleoside-triphosphatase THEP1